MEVRHGQQLCCPQGGAAGITPVLHGSSSSRIYASRRNQRRSPSRDTRLPAIDLTHESFLRSVNHLPGHHTIMAVEHLTYTQIAERLGASVEAARALVKQHRLPRSRARGKTMVSIDLHEIQDQPPAAQAAARVKADKIATLKARIDQLETELAAHRAEFEREHQRTGQLETELASERQCAADHRADFERERQRAAQLETELATEQQRSAGYRADFERERDRADQLAAKVGRVRAWSWWWSWPLRV